MILYFLYVSWRTRSCLLRSPAVINLLKSAGVRLSRRFSAVDTGTRGHGRGVRHRALNSGTFHISFQRIETMYSLNVIESKLMSIFLCLYI